MSPAVPSKKARKSITDTLSIERRKAFFINTPTNDMQESMKQHVFEVERYLDSNRTDNECHFHPQPPEYNSRSAGRIDCYFSWRDLDGSHRFNVNWGVVALLLRSNLTDAQNEGFIHKAWQLSHLCCNWTCCNWRHFTVESGPINVSRNRCFNSLCKCPHSPPCMKDKKTYLPLIPTICNKIGILVFELQNHHHQRHQRHNYGFDFTSKRFVRSSFRRKDPGSCRLCDDHSQGSFSHFCPVLRSLTNCGRLLYALRSCPQPTKDLTQAIGYLETLKADLEQAKQVNHNALSVWLAQSSQANIGPVQVLLAKKKASAKRKPLSGSSTQGKIVKPPIKAARGPSYTIGELDKLWGSARVAEASNRQSRRLEGLATPPPSWTSCGALQESQRKYGRV